MKNFIAYSAQTFEQDFFETHEEATELNFDEYFYRGDE